MGKNACLKFFRKRLRSSTIPEVIVSLTICLVVFSISMRFILKMQTAGNMETRQRAELLLHNAAAGLETSAVPDPDLYYHGNLSLYADSLADENYPKLIHLVLSVKLPQGKVIQSASLYIRKNRDETSN